MERSPGGKKIINLILIAFTVSAGGLWWAIGELFYYTACTLLKAADTGFQYILMPFIIGLYFSLLAVFSILSCVLSESIVPSIVNRTFFNTAVKPPLLKTMLVSFIAMMIAAFLLQLIYELNFKPKQTELIIEEETVEEEVAETVYETIEAAGFDDYYFVMDRSGSMEWNDPDNERLKLLSRIVDRLPDGKKAALISFDDEVSVDIPLQEVNRQIKDTFNSIAGSLSPRNGTDIVAALEVLSENLDGDKSRSGTVILISDGNSVYEENYLNQVLSPLAADKIPVHTVMLTPKEITEDLTEGIALLRSISGITGGRQSTVDNFADLEKEVIRSITAPVTSTKTVQVIRPKTTRVIREAEEQDEPVRSLIAKREGKTESSGIYRTMRILFIAAAGLLMGMLTYVVFSHGNIFKLMLVNGSVSGILAGLPLEFGLQGNQAPPLMRLVSCIILSAFLWTIPVLYKTFLGKVRYIADVDIFNGNKSGFTEETYYDENTENKPKGGRQGNTGNGVFEGKGKERYAGNDKGRLI
jgi:Ca-activated chloride channel family protein